MKRTLIGTLIGVFIAIICIVFLGLVMFFAGRSLISTTDKDVRVNYAEVFYPNGEKCIQGGCTIINFGSNYVDFYVNGVHYTTGYNNVVFSKRQPEAFGSVKEDR